MLYTDARLIIMAKAPTPGFVNTRLAARIGEDSAAQVHRLLTLHTLETIEYHPSCPVELWCTPNAEHPFIKDCQKKYPITLRTQQGENLGERMAHAFKTTLESSGKAIMIGTDCPYLSSAHLHGALDALSDGQDAVITPADDGGYVLIGLRRFSPMIFSNIAWGTQTVYQASCARLQQLGWPWLEHGQLSDIDTPADLDRLMALDITPQIPGRLGKLINALKSLDLEGTKLNPTAPHT